MHLCVEPWGTNTAADGIVSSYNCSIAIDVAASQLYVENERHYRLQRAARTLKPAEMLSYIAELCGQYPIVSVEDPFDQDDWEHWRSL